MKSLFCRPAFLRDHTEKGTSGMQTESALNILKKDV